MIRLIVQKEIRAGLLSLRFGLTFALLVALFAANGAIFIGVYEEAVRTHREATTKEGGDFREACKEMSGMALYGQAYILTPQATGFLGEGFEKYLQNTIRVNAFRTFDPVEGRQGNFLYPRFADLDWFFIVGVVLSLTVLLMTYDGVCGEREDGTLRLTASFPVSRSALILGKYLGTMAVVGVALLFGALIDLAILHASPLIHLGVEAWLRVGIALGASLAYLSCFALMGLAVSALTRQPSTSLVVLLFLWVLLCLIIPNAAGMLAGKVDPIPKRMAINKQVSQARQDVVKNAPKGTWSYNSGDPFMPNHRLRAEAVTRQLNAEVKILDAYWNQMVGQATLARTLARVSPAGAYTSLCEAAAGTGVHRLIALRRELQVYKEGLMEFVRRRDADDPKSPHWINPQHGFFFSKQPISFEEIPRYSGSGLSLGQSMGMASLDIGLLGLFNVLFFAVGYTAFLRYDAR